MSFVLPPYNFPVSPVPNITPFTYRDGVTYLERMEDFIKWLNTVVVPFVNDNYSELAETFTEEVNSLITTVNAALADILNNTIELQDAVMAEILNDDESLTGARILELLANVIQQVPEDDYGIFTEIVDGWNAVGVDNESLFPERVMQKLESLFAGKSVETTKANSESVYTKTQADDRYEPKFNYSGVKYDDLHIPAYNASPHSLYKWAMDIGYGLETGELRKILAIGDSNTEGPTDVQHSWPEYLIDMLNRAGVKTRPGIVTAATNIEDQRWAPTAGWVKLGSAGPAGDLWTAPAGNGTPIYLAPKINFTNLIIHFRGTSAGEIVVIDGEEEVLDFTPSSITAGTYGHSDVSYSGDDETVMNIGAPASGQVQILGFEAFDWQEHHNISVTNFGSSGAKVDDFTTKPGSLEAISYVAPQLSIIELGSNDAMANKSRSLFGSQLRTLVAKCKETGDVILVSPPQIAPAFDDHSSTLIPEYALEMREIAYEMNCLFIDFNARLGGYSAGNPGYRDEVHQSNRANYDLARVLRSFIIH